MISRSSRLDHVAYDIRGKIYEQAQALEKAGHTILSLHIGNPAPFGFNVPQRIIDSMVAHLHQAQGYGDAIGLPQAREAILKYYQDKGIQALKEENIYVGNGVSELVLMSLQALLNDGDEILIPTPDYPLWSSAVHLFGGKTVYYTCDAQGGWYPDIADMRSKITARTKGIVIINPNNPTGAVYPAEVLQQIIELAAAHQLVVFSDEIYDKILYDGVKHTPIASLSKDVLCLTFSGLTKNYRAPGFRAGWMAVSGNTKEAQPYIDGITLLANLRVCGNQQVQYAIKTALEGYQCIDDLVLPLGRLHQQRDVCYEKIRQIPGLSCVKPQGAFYLFAKIDLPRFNLSDDREFVYRLLEEEKVLVVSGSGFNYYQPDHFRVVFLPEVQVLGTALDRIGAFLERESVEVVGKN